MTEEISVDLKGLCLDAALWQRFSQLPESVKIGYLSRCINDCMENIFEDPDLMGWEMQQHLKADKLSAKA